jgi:SAM-dependent methyltransferase
MTRPPFIERVLFGAPALYRAKRFLIEVLLWRWILAGVFRLPANPLPNLASVFAGRRVLLAACGPGDVLTGPPITGAATVVAFDLSKAFVAACARCRPDWKVYAGDLLRIPHRDGSFDVAVLYSTLHHIPADAASVLRELGRVTAGCVVLVEGVVPASGLLRSALLLWYRLVDGGCHYYTRAELDESFARLGLPVESDGLYGPIRHMRLAVLRTRGAAVQEPSERRAIT